MVISRTPYRISFFGGGTDYPGWFQKEGGAVLSTTIDKYCYISCRNLPPFFQVKHRIVWSKIETISELQDITHPAIREFLKDYFPDGCPGMEIHHQGDLPARSGIGSSSSFAVGLIKALHALQGRIIGRHDLAKEAIRLEQELLGENVGCQDQIAAAYGGFNTIEFKKNGEFTVEPLTVLPERLEALNDSLFLYYTGTSRIASEIAGDVIANMEQKQQHLRRMRSMVDEGAAILASERPLDEFGLLLDEAWQQKRCLSNLISNSGIDDIYDRAKAAGALGGKLLGAGSSGFMIFYVPPQEQDRFKSEMSGLLNIPFRFEGDGGTIIHYSR